MLVKFFGELPLPVENEEVGNAVDGVNIEKKEDLEEIKCEEEKCQPVLQATSIGWWCWKLCTWE